MSRVRVHNFSISLDGFVRAMNDRSAVAEPQLDLVDELLDDGRRVDGALRERARRDAAAARLVPRELCSVY